MKGKPLKFSSKLEQKAYEIISQIFENTRFRIYLHYYFPDIEKQVDIAIPDLHIAIEVHGEQHRDKNHFFNKMKVNQFDRQQNRDQELREILSLNNWKLIELYEEDLTPEIIKQKIFGE